MFTLGHCITVELVGGSSSNEGNVYAFNPDIDVYGPICEDTWDKHDVRALFCMILCPAFGFVKSY